jgi:hypothetical protein
MVIVKSFERCRDAIYRVSPDILRLSKVFNTQPCNSVFAASLHPVIQQRQNTRLAMQKPMAKADGSPFLRKHGNWLLLRHFP